MFETAVVHSRPGDRRYGFLSLSLGVHMAAVAAVIAASLSSTKLPQESPKQLMKVYFSAPPPALGTPRPVEDRRSRLSGQAGLPVLHQIPNAIPSVAPAATTESAGGGEPAGLPTGTPGGIGTTEAPSAPDAAGPIPVGAGVQAPVVIHRVDPLYPQIALRGRMNGWVVLQCIIDKTGHIRDVRVVHSSFAAFEQPAIDAVQQWLFAPGTLNGQAVDVIFELTVKFQVR
jgi:periplasmic protein TonB